MVVPYLPLASLFSHRARPQPLAGSAPRPRVTAQACAAVPGLAGRVLAFSGRYARLPETVSPRFTNAALSAPSVLAAVFTGRVLLSLVTVTACVIFSPFSGDLV